MRPLSVCFDRLALAEDLHARARSRSRATSGATTTSAPPPSVITQQSSRCSGSADHRRVEDLLDGDRVAQEGVRVVLGMVRRGDLDLGELRAGGAELVHVSAGGKRIERRDDRSRSDSSNGVSGAPSRARRRRAAAAGAAGLPASVISATWHLPAAIARGGVADVHEVRRPAGLGRVDVAHGCRPRYSVIEIAAEARRVAVAEVPVDVGEGRARHQRARRARPRRGSGPSCGPGSRAADARTRPR